MAVSKIPKYGHRDVVNTSVDSSHFYNGFSSGTDGSVKYIVKSGICYVSLRKCKFTQGFSSPDTKFLDGLPPAPSGIYIYFLIKTVDDYIFRAYVSGSEVRNLNSPGSSSTFLNQTVYATFSYPVTDSWVS